MFGKELESTFLPYFTTSVDVQPVRQLLLYEYLHYVNALTATCYVQMYM